MALDARQCCAAVSPVEDTISEVLVTWRAGTIGDSTVRKRTIVARRMIREVKKERKKGIEKETDFKAKQSSCAGPVADPAGSLLLQL